METDVSTFTARHWHDVKHFAIATLAEKQSHRHAYIDRSCTDIPDLERPTDQESIIMAPAAKRRKTEQVEKYRCFSCDEHRTAKQFPDYNPSSECDHLINTCKGCLKKWVAAQVDSASFTVGGEDGKAFGVRCPQCDAVMKNVNIELAANKKVYEK
jgi:hypothetical protein